VPNVGTSNQFFFDTLGDLYTYAGNSVIAKFDPTLNPAREASLNYSAITTMDVIAMDPQGNFYAGSGSWGLWYQPASPSGAQPIDLGYGPYTYSPALDNQGNVYFANYDGQTISIEKIANGWLALPAAAFNEPADAGNDTISVQLLPATAYTAQSDSTWLTVVAAGNGIVRFSFDYNGGAPRSGHIAILGNSVTVNQAGNLSLTNTAGDQQTAQAGQPFSLPLTGSVTDSSGNPLASVPVAYTINPGGGKVTASFTSGYPTSASLETGSNGTAVSPTLVAGTTAGSSIFPRCRSLPCSISLSPAGRPRRSPRQPTTRALCF
jgi:hypothetical protein